MFVALGSGSGVGLAIVGSVAVGSGMMVRTGEAEPICEDPRRRASEMSTIASATPMNAPPTVQRIPRLNLPLALASIR